MDNIALKLEKKIFVPNSKCFSLCVHDGIELIYITKGGLSFKCEASSRIAHTGDIIVFNHRQVHSAMALENGAEYYVLYFGLSEFVNASSKIAISLISGKIRLKNHIKDDSINSLIEKIIAEYSKTDDISAVMLDGYLKVLYASLVRAYLSSTQFDSSITNNRFAVALSYINEHYTEDITTKSMAEMMSYEESYFCHKFHTITGMSFINYVRKLRMERARDMLLENSSRDIKKIALSCGYSDTNYFTRCFKSYYGMTPTKMIAMSHNS